jgi:hypothetical protein
MSEHANRPIWYRMGFADPSLWEWHGDEMPPCADGGDHDWREFPENYERDLSWPRHCPVCNLTEQNTFVPLNWRELLAARDAE